MRGPQKAEVGRLSRAIKQAVAEEEGEKEARPS